MQYKKEVCTNFQRSSCQNGQRCGYLHVTQYQPKSNPFECRTQFIHPDLPFYQDISTTRGVALSSTLQATRNSSTMEPYAFRFPTTRVMVVEDGDDIETIDFDLPEQAEGCPLPENVESVSRKTAENLMRVVEGAKNAIVQYVISSRNKIRQMESCIQEKDVEIAKLRSEVERLQQPPPFVFHRVFRD